MRDPHLHEKAAFLALGLLAGESPHSVRVQLADRFNDEHRGTDLFLVEKRKSGKTKILRIDLTEGHREAVARKFRRNRQLTKNGRGHWVWILRVRREDVIEIAVDPCFTQAWDRMKTYEPAAFSPQDICPKHGRDCTLVARLSSLGRNLVFHLRKDFQALFE